MYMPDLVEKQRKAMNKDVFAYVDASGVGHLPLNDESHVRNAMARWNQTGFASASAKESARRKIVAAAKKHGIEISRDDKVARPSSSLRAAHTKRGPRGGRTTAQPKRKTTTAQRRAARRNIKKAVRSRAKSRS
jgi:hypothetical protein